MTGALWRYRGALCVVGFLLAAGNATSSEAKTKQPRFAGELVLDFDDPVVEAQIGGVPLRLRVDLDQDDVIELNPGMAAQLPIEFGPGFDAEVGRVTLEGTTAVINLTVAGRTVRAQLASHGRDCCDGVDGAIGPALLPFALIRFVRAGWMGSADEQHLAMANDPQSGLYAPVDGLQLRFSLSRQESVATASAAAKLAEDYDGRFDGPYRQSVGAFGIARPARLMRFPQPVPMAGFPVRTLLVRTADFGGKAVLPSDEAGPDDIVVSKRPPEQHDWPSVLLARDFLEACGEILLTNPDHRLVLRCDFAAAP